MALGIVRPSQLVRARPGHQAGVPYVRIGKMHACTALRIIPASTSLVVLTNIDRLAAPLRPLLAIFPAWSENESRESKKTPNQRIDPFLAIGFIILGSSCMLANMAGKTISGLGKFRFREK